MTDEPTGLKIKAYSVSGPASYSTGGFTHDASADFSTIKFVRPVVTTPGSLPPCDFEIDVDKTQAGTEAFGQCAIKIVRERYDRATISSITGLPAGVTGQASKFAAATTTGSSHTHDFSHGHTVESATPDTDVSTEGGDTAIGGTPINVHTHTATRTSNILGSTSTTHTHLKSFEYEHDHPLASTTVTDVAATELAAATNISTTTFSLIIYGFGPS